MIIWINGAFGSGKTAAAFELCRRLPGSAVFDPENFGFFMRKNLPSGILNGDFQDEPLWREVNYRLLKIAAERYPGHILVPMTITNPQYYGEIIETLRRDGVDVRHVLLKVDGETLRKRLKKRFDGKNSWPAKQIPRCLAAFENPLFENGIDTRGKSVARVAEEIARICGVELKRETKSKFSRWFGQKFISIKHIR